MIKHHGMNLLISRNVNLNGRNFTKFRTSHFKQDVLDHLMTWTNTNTICLHSQCLSVTLGREIINKLPHWWEEKVFSWWEKSQSVWLSHESPTSPVWLRFQHPDINKFHSLTDIYLSLDLLWGWILVSFLWWLSLTFLSFIQFPQPSDGFACVWIHLISSTQTFPGSLVSFFMNDKI